MITICITILFFLVFYLISHYFFRRYLLKDDCASILNDYFSFLFAYSNILLLMIISEITNEDSEENNFWNMSIWIYMNLLYFLIPFQFITYILDNSFKNILYNKIKFYSLIVIYIAYLVITNLFYFFLKSSNDGISFNFYFSFSNITEYLGFISIIISSILSSYGSVQLIFSFIYFPFFKSRYYENKYNDKIKRLSSITQQLNINSIEMGEGFKSTNNKENYNNTYFLSSSDNLKTGELSRGRIKNELIYFNDELKIEIKMILEKNKYNDRFFNENYNEDERKHSVLVIKYTILKFFGRVLAFYSLYRILNTAKNLLFSDYNNINLTLREDALNIVDWVVMAIAFIFRLQFTEVYYTVVEQYFSLLIVSIVILTNLRSFLIMLQFIYLKLTKVFKKIKLSKTLQILFLTYLCCLFYITSTLFLISNLPLKYRTEIAKFYGNIDFSLQKLYYDKIYIVFTLIFIVIEIILNLIE